jgi:hypothetical protein
MADKRQVIVDDIVNSSLQHGYLFSFEVFVASVGKAMMSKGVTSSLAKEIVAELPGIYQDPRKQYEARK